MIDNIKCKLGFHSWTGIYQYSEIQKSSWESIQAIRCCKYCEKYEELDVHCLGLNPPEYVRTWLPISWERYNEVFKKHWDNYKDDTTSVEHLLVSNLKTKPHYRMINGVWTEVKK